jgi:hypothetical protein
MSIYILGSTYITLEFIELYTILNMKLTYNNRSKIALYDKLFIFMRELCRHQLHFLSREGITLLSA